MEAHDERYNEIIGKLRNLEPELADAASLTDNILKKITSTPLSGTMKAIRMVRPWLSIASVFLIGLFAYQHTETPEPLPSKEVVFVEEIDDAHACLDSIAGDTSRIENLIESYLCYLQHEEIKKRYSEFMEQMLLLNREDEN